MAYMLYMGTKTSEWLTIVETATFIKRAEKVLQPEEVDDLKQILANTPELGDIISHSGGIRKVRVSARQKGKSGGARVIYYYRNDKIPLFLLDVYTKSEKVDLSKEELTILRALTEQLRKIYGG
jgi:hypothetical protein